MPDEFQLFAEFAESRSEAAFTGLLRLHGKLVFATAFRQVGDRALAEEIAQNVFLALSRQADSLRGNRTLAGWLYRTTLNQSRQCLRSEFRRKHREQVAAAISECGREGNSVWSMLIPLLDEALLTLNEKDRLAVLLHFMEARPFREVGAALKVGEDGARKRVQRALAALTCWFQKRGVAVPTTAIVGALALEGIGSPALNAAGILLAGGAAAGSISSVSSLALIMSSTQIKIGVAVLALAIAVTTPLLLRDHPAPEKPASRPGTPPDAKKLDLSRKTAGIRPANSVPAQPPAPEKSFLQRLNDGDMSLSMLSRDEAEAFIALNKTNAASLLAAYRVTHDLEYLRQAAIKYPTDPAVLLRAITHDAFPEARREWINRFKNADPSNALAGLFVRAALLAGK